MHTQVTKRLEMTAAQLRDFMLLDFDGDEQHVITDVKHLAHKVLFSAGGTAFTLDRDEIVYRVTRMRIGD